MNVIWKPQPRQALFMSRPEYEAFYGGSAGGGKSDALICEALRQVHIPYYKGLILRKTYPQLEELIDKSLRYYPSAYPRAKYNVSTHTWTFPSGAKILFRSLQHSKNKTDFQGQAYDFIAFDELTHFTYDEYSYLFSRNRPNGAGTRVYIRSTGNPSGIGHGWVKERFITASKPMTPIKQTVRWYNPDGSMQEVENYRIFVPSTVWDNPALLANDPMYISRLASMPEAERNALLYGDWNSFSGQVFTEWRDNPDHYLDRVGTHVIAPFRIPKDWKIWCGLDWGYARPYSIGYYAVDYDGRLYRIAEIYGCNGTPNTGVKEEPTAVALKMKELEQTDPNLKGRQILRVGDPAIWQEDGRGHSIGSLFEKERIYFDLGDHARLSGKMQCHYRLTMDEEGLPMFYVFNTCKNFIRTIPNLVYDETHVEDVDTDGEDHAYDEWRYICMANTISPAIPQKKIIRPYNPLDDDFDTYNYDRYEWWRNN